MSEPRQFTNAQEAFAKGVEEGARDKQNGGLVDALDFNRELHEEGFKRQRGRDAPFYEDWRRGYNAGYLGLERPAVSVAT